MERSGTTARIWDGLWLAAAKITEDGWTATVEVPFSTLNFRGGSDVTVIRRSTVPQPETTPIRMSEHTTARDMGREYTGVRRSATGAYDQAERCSYSSSAS